jgi:hypothetical protein
MFGEWRREVNDPVFLEDKVLHAALAQDEDALDATLEEMLDGELLDLARACQTVANEAFHRASTRRNRVPSVSR